ncbi:MAG: hypothetical protein Q8Q09_15865 [Deltaproteobacteria bacterium]|nr:hypothetical protein [Deltaproteobacteria bacterium]
MKTIHVFAAPIAISLALSLSAVAPTVDAQTPPAAPMQAVQTLSDASNPATSPGAAPTVPPVVESPPSCTLDQVESLGRSAWWEALPTACTARFALSTFTLDAPPDVPSRIWSSFLQQCEHGRSARMLCDVPEEQRVQWLASIQTHVQRQVRRAHSVSGLCDQLPALRTALGQQPADRQATLAPLLSHVETFCTARTGTLPPLTSVGLLRALLPAQDQPAPPGGQSDSGGSQRAGSAESQSIGGRHGEGGIASLTAPGAILDIALQGLTQLLVQRAQAELEAFAIESMRTVLCSERARPWFEHTCEFLGPGGESTLRVSIGAGMRAAFQSDVLALPTRVVSVFPRRGDARALTGYLYFDLLASWVQQPSPQFAAERMLALGEQWEPSTAATGARGAREIDAARKARDAVLATGLLLSAITHREGFDRLPDTAIVPLIATLVGHDLSPRERGAIRGLRASIVRYRAVGQGVRVTGRGAVELNTARAASALGALVDLLNTAVPIACSDRTVAAMVTLPGRLPELLLAISRANLPQIVVETTRAMAAVSLSFGLPESVVRGMSLAAEVASAQTPEQVRSALDAAIAPVGSWRMKRRRPMVSLGALVGGGGGAEWAIAGGGLIDPSMLPTLNLVGAVGLDASYPFRGGTIGGFFSVIDVGGLMSLPVGQLQATVLGDDGNPRSGIFEVSPRISPEQVLSPGLYVRWGIFNTPLVLGAGASVTPLARRVQELRGPTTGAMPFAHDVSVFRAGIFLAVDVTLLPF